MNILYLIPARGGSKGIPYKNIKPLDGKPLIYYSIDSARQMTGDENICVSTDDGLIAEKVRGYGLEVPFMRPGHLATDSCGTYEVLLNALEHYRAIGREYDLLVLLQPTSPFRRKEHLERAIATMREGDQMVVSVREARTNPYYNSYEEDTGGYLRISKGDGKYTRRQDVPQAWEYNGSIYVIDVPSLMRCPLPEFDRIRKFPMEDEYSVDIDNMMDWKMAEMMLNEKMIEL